MFKRHHNELPADNTDILTHTYAAQVVHREPVTLLLDGTELRRVEPVRVFLKDIDPDSAYGRRMALAKFIETLQLVDAVLGVDLTTVETLNRTVQERDFYVSLGALPLSQAVKLDGEIPVAKVISVEIPPFDAVLPAVIVQGSTDSMATLNTGAELLAPRIAASYATNPDRSLPYA